MPIDPKWERFALTSGPLVLQMGIISVQIVSILLGQMSKESEW